MLGTFRNTSRFALLLALALFVAMMVPLSAGAAFSAESSLTPPAVFPAGFGKNSSSETKTHLSGDVNADGFADAIAVTAQNGSWSVALSNGSTLDPATAWGSSPSDSKYLLGDVTGDGAADAISFSSSKGRWWVSAATKDTSGRYIGFASAVNFTPTASFPLGFGTGSGVSVFLGDVNADGKADAVAYKGSAPSYAWSVATSTGTSFNVAATWTPQGIGPSNVQYLADVTGDGAADAVMFIRSSAQVWVAKATKNSSNVFDRFGPVRRFTSNETSWNVYVPQPLFGDVDFDGMKDLVVYYPNYRRWMVGRSTGSAFLQPELWDSGAFAAESTFQSAMDINGDGRADAVTGNSATGGWTYGRSADPVADEALPARDYPYWKRIFADDFSKSAPLGSWANPSDNCLDLPPWSRTVYTGNPQVLSSGSVEPSWTTYPNCATDTFQHRRYRPESVLSVHDGWLDFWLHPVDGQPAGANPSPKIRPSQGTLAQFQQFGRYEVRMRAEADVGSTLADYKVAWLLWPELEGDWQCGESDFPEAQLNSSSLGAYSHHCDGTQDEYLHAIDFSQWHTYTQEWNALGRFYFIDGKLIGASSTTYPMPADPLKKERWQLQTETKTDNPTGGSGHVYVDWAVVYCRTVGGVCN